MSRVAKYVLNNPGALRQFSKDVKRDLVSAAARTLNQVAYQARGRVVEAERREFTLRNTYTERQTQYTKTKYNGDDLRNLRASVGITEKAGYMALQEQGGYRTPSAKTDHLAIATDAARRGSPANPVARKYYFSKNKIVRGAMSKKRSHKANRVAAAAVAYRTGKLMQLDNNNIVEVTAFRRGDETGHIFDTRLIYTGKYKKTRVGKRKFFVESAQVPLEDIQEIFNRIMDGGA